MKKARGETENKRVYGLEAQIVETIKERITTQMEGWERGETESGVYYIYTIPGKSGEILVHLLPPKVSKSDNYELFVYHQPKEGGNRDMHLNFSLNLEQLYREVKKFNGEKMESRKDPAREEQLQPLAKILGITSGTAI